MGTRLSRLPMSFTSARRRQHRFATWPHHIHIPLEKPTHWLALTQRPFWIVKCREKWGAEKGVCVLFWISYYCFAVLGSISAVISFCHIPLIFSLLGRGETDGNDLCFHFTLSFSFSITYYIIWKRGKNVTGPWRFLSLFSPNVSSSFHGLDMEMRWDEKRMDGNNATHAKFLLVFLTFSLFYYIIIIITYIAKRKRASEQSVPQKANRLSTCPFKSHPRIYLSCIVNVSLSLCFACLVFGAACERYPNSFMKTC